MYRPSQWSLETRIYFSSAGPEAARRFSAFRWLLETRICFSGVPAVDCHNGERWRRIKLKALQEFTMTGALPYDEQLNHTRPERRKKRRTRPKVLSGIVETNLVRQVVTIADLSLAGARIVNAPPCIELGEQIQLAIMIDGHAAVPFPCTVIHKKGNEAHLEIGVQFDPVDPEQSRGLAWYLRETADSSNERSGKITSA
jgi:hypothetical protein